MTRGWPPRSRPRGIRPDGQRPADTLSDAAQASAQIVASAGQRATGAQISLAMRSLDQAAQQNLAATREVEQARGTSTNSAPNSGLTAD
ncbi:MAG: hypothetical protein WKF75_00280 [Singulisphaera sp.]